MCIYTYIYIYMYIHIYRERDMFTYIYIYKHKFIRRLPNRTDRKLTWDWHETQAARGYVYVCMCIYIYIYIYTYTHKCMGMSRRDFTWIGMTRTALWPRPKWLETPSGDRKQLDVIYNLTYAHKHMRRPTILEKKNLRGALSVFLYIYRPMFFYV